MIERLFLQMLEISFFTSILSILFFIIARSIPKYISVKIRYYVILILALRLLIPYGIDLFNTPSFINNMLIHNQEVKEINSIGEKIAKNDFSEDSSVDIKDKNKVTDENNKSINSNQLSDNLAMIESKEDKSEVSTKSSNSNIENNQNLDKKNSKDFVSRTDESKALVSYFNLSWIQKHILYIISIIWIIGIMIFFLYHFLCYVRFIRKVKKSSIKVTDTKTLNIFTNLKKRKKVNKEISLYYCKYIFSPMLIGFAKPVILLPTIDFESEELLYMLEHELIHDKKHDILYKLLLLIARGIHFYNPVVHYMAKQAEEDIEILCDDEVIQDKNSVECGHYCDAILKVMKYQMSKTSYVTASLSSDKKRLKERFGNILDHNKKAIKKEKRPIIVLSLIMFTIVAFVGCKVNAFKLSGGMNQSNNHTNIETSKEQKIEKLYELKTPYVGNISKVERVVAALNVPKSLSWLSLELKTEEEPYGAIFKYKINDYKDLMHKGAINSFTFNKNAILMFALIDNVDDITYHLEDGVMEGASYDFTFNRNDSNQLMNMDIQEYVKSYDNFKSFYGKVMDLKYEEIKDIESGNTSVKNFISKMNRKISDKTITKIEKAINKVISKHQTSSSTVDYAMDNRDYEELIKICYECGDESLVYILQQFEEDNEADNIDGLRGQILKYLCVELLGYRNSVEEWKELLPSEWYKKLEILEAKELPEFIFTDIVTTKQKDYINWVDSKLKVNEKYFKDISSKDRITKLTYLAAYKNHYQKSDTVATIIAPTIYGSTNENGIIEIFATIYEGQYQLYGDTIHELSASEVPCKIIYKYDKKNKEYYLDDYIKAKDGSYFNSSIKEFCGKHKDIANKMIRGYSNNNSKNLMVKNISNYVIKNDIKANVIEINDEIIKIKRKL